MIKLLCLTCLSFNITDFCLPVYFGEWKMNSQLRPLSAIEEDDPHLFDNFFKVALQGTPSPTEETGMLFTLELIKNQRFFKETKTRIIGSVRGPKLTKFP